MLEILAICSPVASILFAFIAFKRNQKYDDSATAREMGTLLTDIGYIKSQMDTLNRKFEHQDERYTALIERLSIVEQSAKTAHRRIDIITNESAKGE